MADEEVKIKYSADVDDYVAGVDRVQRETTETSDSIVDNNERSGSSFDAMKLKAVAFGIALIAGTKQVVDWLVMAADKANDNAFAMRGLEMRFQVL